MAGKGVGMSRYRGLRVTLTFGAEGTGTAFLTVAVKQPTGGWDEWTSLVPTVRIAHEFQADLQGAIDAVLMAMDDHEDIAWSSRP